MALDHDRTRALSALAAIDPGCDRETWHEVGRAAIAAGLSVDDIDAWSANADNYKGRRDVESSFGKIEPDGGTRAATLFYHARLHGWRDDKPAKTASPKRDIAATESPSTLWERFTAATTAHPYVSAKRGTPDGLRTVPSDCGQVIAGHKVAGWLVVPVHSADGRLQTLQFIPPPGTGKKLNLPGATFDDGFYVVGNASESDRFFVVEGIGQAWACWSATGSAAVVTFGAGRMAAVTNVLQRHYPTHKLVLVPDRGKEAQAAEIARGASCAWVELPSDKPANYDCNDYAQEFGGDALDELLKTPKHPPQRYAILTADELAALPPLRWRVKRVFPDRGVAVVFGASGSGKTFLVLDFAEHIASGRAWFGYQTAPCAVVYVGLEGSAGLSQRVQAYHAHHDGDAAQGMHFIIQPVDLLATGDVSDLATAIRGTGAGVVIIDTLNAAAPGADENASQDMGRVIAAAKRLQDAVGGLVVLVHHSGKDAARGLRGHSSLFAAMDAVLEVVRDGARREWKLSKSKDGADGQAHPFRLVVVPLGTDDDGDPITSCVIEPDDTPADGVRRAALPGGGNMRLAWDAIGDLLKRSTNQGMASAPPGRPCVTLEEAIAAAAPRLPCEAKRQRERAQQAVTGLVGRGNLAHADGWVWLP